jgi:hypothetical protein
MHTLELHVVVRRRPAICGRCECAIDTGDRAVRFAAVDGSAFEHGIYCLDCCRTDKYTDQRRLRGKRGRRFGANTVAGKATCAAARRGR